MKMKYIFCILIILGCTYSVQAQWTSDITVNTFTIAGLQPTGDLPKVTAGKTTGSFVTWVQSVPGKIRTGLYAQAFDKNGNRLWGDNGVLIDTLMGSTRFKYDQKADNNGDLIIGIQNIRVASYRQFPVIYKLSKTDGSITWKKEITDSAQSYASLSPSLSITSANNVLVGWTKIRLLQDSTEITDACVQKLKANDGSFMFTQNLTITDASNSNSNSQPQIIPSGSAGENFILSWQTRSVNSGQGPFSVYAQRYNSVPATPTTYWSTTVLLATSHLMVTGATTTMMSDGASGAVFVYPVAGKYGTETYAQYVDNNGNIKWGSDALLLATNTQGSANNAGVVFDINEKKLWFSISQDAPTTSVRTQTIYLQGVDASGNFLRNGYTTGGVTVIPPVTQNMTNAQTIMPVTMKSTGDGFVIVYAQGTIPAPTIVKAVKVDTLGKKLWPGEDSITIVSTRPGLAGGVLSDFIDNELIMAMTARPDGSISGNAYQVAQNINSNGSVGVNAQRQVITFNTDTLYVVYGDVPYPLNAVSNSGISPVYTVSDPTKGKVDENGNLQFLDVGTFTVTPFFPSSTTYMAKQGSAKVIVVRKGRTLKVIADNNTKEYGWMLPTLTMRFDTFVPGDDAYSAFTKLPTIYCAANKNSPVGVYPITLQGGVSSKYFIELVNAQLTVYPQGGKDKDNMDAYCSSPSELKVIIYSLQNNSGTLQLSDMGGRILYNANVAIVQGVTNFTIPVGALSGGVYIARFIGNNQPQLSQKVRVK